MSGSGEITIESNTIIEIIVDGTERACVKRIRAQAFPPPYGGDMTYGLADVCRPSWYRWRRSSYELGVRPGM